MAQRIDNVRFPHSCKIYRMVGEDSFSDGEEEVLYEGVCRKYSASAIRTFVNQNVIKTDYAMSIPNTEIAIKAGDMLEVTDKTGTYKNIHISDVYVGTMGTTLQFNLSKN